MNGRDYVFFSKGFRKKWRHGEETVVQVACCVFVYYWFKPIWHRGHILSNRSITTAVSV